MRLKTLIAGQLQPSAARRISPVSCAACLVTVWLLAIGIVASLSTHFMLASLPNIVLLIIGILILDVLLLQFAPRIRIVEAVQSLLYGVLYLAITSVCAVLAAYSLQRLAFPLRDQTLQAADLAIGFDWLAYAHWVDRHPLVQSVFHAAYYSIWPQTFLPLVVFVFTRRIREARVYLLTFSMALTATLFVSALLPAVGPIVFFDRTTFDVLRFTGATPLDQLARLRETGPLIQTAFPGGIATFPSFHATMATLTPLALRRDRRFFIPLLVLNALMLASTLSEGAHYLIDVIAGTAMAFLAYAVARWVIAMEGGLFARGSRRMSGARYAPT
jgi:membrane-associated phospholipid phosphatase